MNKQYIQSISTFSIALPIVFALILIGLISFIKSSLLGDFPKTQEVYKNEQSQLVALNKLQERHSEKSKQLEVWHQLLRGDSFTKVNERFRQAVANNNKTKTLQVTDQKRVNGSIPSVDAKNSACAFAIEGTFSELQLCMTELECKLPNLMVNTMSIRPESNNNLLNLKLNYTIWEKEQ